MKTHFSNFSNDAFILLSLFILHPVIAFVNDKDTSINEVDTGGGADAVVGTGTDGDNETTTRLGTRIATEADAASVDSVDVISATGSVPQSDSASGLACVLGSSACGVSITQRGVNTNGSARSVAGTGKGHGG